MIILVYITVNYHDQGSIKEDPTRPDKCSRMGFETFL